MYGSETEKERTSVDTSTGNWIGVGTGRAVGNWNDDRPNRYHRICFELVA